MGGLIKIYNDLKNDFPLFYYVQMNKKEGLSKNNMT